MTHEKLARLTAGGLFAALLCVLSPIVIPLGGPVPFALQNFGVMLCAVSLGWGEAQGAVLAYLLLGLFLPLFSGGNTGLTAITGPTGGYIWSYLLMVPVIRGFRALPARTRRGEFGAALAGCLLAVAVCYLCGTAQFSLVTGNTFAASLSVCVVPFIGFDAVKAAAAAFLGVELARVAAKAP